MPVLGTGAGSKRHDDSTRGRTYHPIAVITSLSEATDTDAVDTAALFNIALTRPPRRCVSASCSEMGSSESCCVDDPPRTKLDAIAARPSAVPVPSAAAGAAGVAVALPVAGALAARRGDVLGEVGGAACNGCCATHEPPLAAHVLHCKWTAAFKA